MKEVIDLSVKILFIPIPLPISFNNILYYNLFSLGVIFLIVGLAVFIIDRMTK